MKYPKEYLDEIKTRLKVSTVVSKSVNLKKRGKEFVGLSPFKNEKTPSFTVNDEKGFYHCFSTSEHGNIFDFVMKTQNLKFGEAVKNLANLAGMRPYTFSKSDEEREKKWKNYNSIFQEYAKIKNYNLINSHSSENAKIYLKKRKLSLNEIKKFNIGYVDDENYYEKFHNKFDDQAIKETGLFYFDERKKKFVDRFKNRIIFPINNISGQTIAFGGRQILENKYSAKYINSPETLFFKKGANLYNLDFARKLSNKDDNIYLVEGYMDVVGLSKNGIENVVANLGTALTEKQIIILNQFFNHIIICFDGDESGYKAAVRAAESSIKELRPNKKISFLFLPDKEDPDSFVNKYGKDYFLNYSRENFVPIHQFIYDHNKNETDNTPSSLAIFEKKMRSVASSIKDEYIRKYTLEYFLEKISNFTPNLSKSKNQFKQKTPKTLDRTKKIFNETKSLTSIEIKEFSFLYLLIENLNFFLENLNIIEKVKIFTKENNFVFEKILEKLKEGKNFDIQDLSLDSQLIDRIYKFSSIKHIVSDNFINDEKKLLLIKEIISDLKNYELEFRIQELESKFSKDFNENTFNELKELKKLQKIN